jgi:hypothetical protein
VKTLEEWEAAMQRTIAADAAAAAWRARVELVDGEAAALEAGMAERALAEPDGAGDYAAEAAEIRDRRQFAEAGLRGAEAAAARARLAEVPLEAAHLRALAVAKRAELAELEAATAGPLAELERLQGCPYAPATWSSPGEDGSLARSAWTTRSDLLRIELHDLIGRAFVLEERAEGRDVAVPMKALEGSPDYALVGRLQEENRLTRERRSADEAAGGRSIVDRARSLVKG